MSHASGVTYLRRTAYSSGSSRPQLSQVPGTPGTLPSPAVGRRVRRLLPAALLVALVACGGASEPVAGSSTTAGPGSTAPATTAVGRIPEGYRAATVRIVAADGSVTVLCVWVADTAERRGRGLMEVDGMGGADGMLFRFGSPSEGAFYMLRTRIPLSIAYFAADGAFVGAQDMVPCPDDDDDPPCPRYPAPGPFTDAIEVPAGGLAALGIGPGSRLDRVGDPCRPGEP